MRREVTLDDVPTDQAEAYARGDEEIEVYARDENGHLYLDGDRIARKVARRGADGKFVTDSPPRAHESFRNPPDAGTRG